MPILKFEDGNDDKKWTCIKSLNFLVSPSIRHISTNKTAIEAVKESKWLEKRVFNLDYLGSDASFDESVM